jgi:hypothetical protein
MLLGGVEFCDEDAALKVAILDCYALRQPFHSFWSANRSSSSLMWQSIDRLLHNFGLSKDGEVCF